MEGCRQSPSMISNVGFYRVRCAASESSISASVFGAPHIFTVGQAKFRPPSKPVYLTIIGIFGDSNWGFHIACYQRS